MTQRTRRPAPHRWSGPLPEHQPFAAAEHAAKLLAAGLGLTERPDGTHIDIAVVCGSGLGAYPETLTNAEVVAMGEGTGFAAPTVPGHAGRIVAGASGGNRVLAYSGRTHLYEGHHVHRTVHNVRVAAALGAHTVVLTNAAGATYRGLAVGQLVAIGDHINLTGANPLEGPLDDDRSRFVDMSHPYDGRLNQVAHRIGWDMWGDAMTPHTYAAFRGPSYETRAEVRMAAAMGADLVGMSTVCETIAARHCGLGVAAFSLVTNTAAGIGTGTLSHTEVAEVAGAAAERTVEFLTRYTAAISAPTT